MTFSGIVISVRLLHSENALSPMLVTRSVIVISFKLLHSKNAYFPILVIPSLIFIFSIILVYCFLCQSASSVIDQSFISPLPEILKLLSSKFQVAIILSS